VKQRRWQRAWSGGFGAFARRIHPEFGSGYKQRDKRRASSQL